LCRHDLAVTPSVRFSDEPAAVLARAADFLGSRPVLHNLILTLLHARVAGPEAGRYWIVEPDDEPAGVVFQSPTEFPAVVTPMPADAVAAAVAAIAAAGVDLPGVSGEAATAAQFAGSWTEQGDSAARPVEGHRIYEVEHPAAPSGVPGRLRAAETADRDLLVDWLRGFNTDAGGIGAGDPATIVDRRLPAGDFWIWDEGGDRGPVSLAAHSEPVCSVRRIQAVYTPPDRRGHGYASACVAALSARILDAGQRCILYTDLANPTSNHVYRRIGYRAVAEGLRYEFT
jgi:uncharacterized protein